MKQMIAKPKDILQNSSIWLLVASFLLLFSCKSKEVTVAGAQVDSISIVDSAFTSEDSLEFLNTLRSKEAQIANYQGSKTREFDLIHLDLELGFDYVRQAVPGVATIKLRPYFFPQNELVLDAKDFELGKINLLDGESRTSLAYRYDSKKVTIYLPQFFTRDDTLDIQVNYTAFPERGDEKGSAAITDTKGLYFIDPLGTDPDKPTMIWTQGETAYSSKWFPTIDSPNQRFTQSFKLTVPDSLISLSNGQLISQKDVGNGLRQDHWEMKIPHAPYLAALAVGDFVRVEDNYGNIPLGYYVEPGFEKGAEIVFKNTPKMISYFSEILGVDFPWPKYDQLVVRDFVSGAMENTTLSIFMEELRLTEREAIDSEWDYIIAHELFHQWFGDYVTTESWSNLTLNEGFANYSEYLWNEHFYGKDVADLKLVAETENYFYEAEGNSKNLIRFYYEAEEDMFDSHSYSKGGAILHMLRRYLGDEAFFGSLNYYLTEHALQSVEVHDLRQAFEKVTGEDLNWFFDQWFLDKGHPELFVNVDYSQPDNVLLSIIQTQDLQENRLFKLPLEVSWYENGERKSKRIMLDRAFQQFALENESPVSLVMLDEQKEVLALKIQNFTAQQWEKQFFQSEFGVARYEAIDSLSNMDNEEALLNVVAGGLEDDFWSVREFALGLLVSKPEWFDLVSDMEKKVVELAERDPKNSVRSAAIDVLATHWADKYSPVFKRMVNDSSYLVAGSALMGLTGSSESLLSLEEVEQFANEENYRMVIPVADYYITASIPNKGDWFSEKSKKLSGEPLSYFLGYYGEYFSRFPNEGQGEAVRFLFDKMGNAPSNFVRLGAFQALLAFADEEEILKEIKSLVAQENDQMLQNYYSYFLQAFEE